MNKQDKKKPSTKNDACDYCHEKKIRCNKHKPQCYECIKRKIRCNYGTRLKRGPKPPAANQLFNSVKAKDQIRSVQKSSPSIEAILFELELNQKFAEFWRILHSKIGEGEVRSPPKFDPATEEFIRAPGVALRLMEEFNSTHRLIYTTHNSAPSVEIAAKIWQIITEVNAADIFLIFRTFKTSHIVSILEYLVVFQISTKVCAYDQIAAYITTIVQHLIDLVVFTRDGTSDSLTPELTLQLLPSLTFVTRYFKLALNKQASGTYHSLIQDLYEQNKSSPLFAAQVEARMLCRKIFMCATKESAEKCLTRVEELDKQGIMTPNLYFHFNNHLAFYLLRNKGQLSDAHKAAQKAEYFIKWHFETVPQEKRQATEDYFTTSLNCVHLEILLRLGNIESALQRVGQMCNAFARLPTAFKLMCSAKFNFLLKTTPCKGEFLALDYLAFVINPNQVLLPSLTPPAFQQGPLSPQSGSTEDIHDQVEGTESSESSSQDYFFVSTAFTLNVSDESLIETLAFSPYDAFSFNASDLEPIHHTEYHTV